MKKLKKKFLFKVEKTHTGFSAYSEGLPVYTTAKHSPELYPHILEALNFYLEEFDQYVDAENLKLQLDLQQFFQHYRVLNAKYLAQRIGMNETLLSQYVQGRKTPSAKQTNRILEGIHEIGKELAEINLVVG